MFTGIISDVGTVVMARDEGDLHLRLACGYPPETIDIGASIACDGACLTVVDRGPPQAADRAAWSAQSPAEAAGWFEVTASAETVGKTTLGSWTPGRRVNLERALRVGDELGGHIVAGHVDGLARIVAVQEEGESTRIFLEAPRDLARYVAPKGSVALNGTSLTVNEVEAVRFGVNVIPHTKLATTWGAAAPGDAVNLEIDTLARYVARLHDWTD